jgi:hypothetical protein
LRLKVGALRAVAHTTLVKRAADTRVTPNPDVKPQRKEATRMAKKKKRKKILLVPLLSPMKITYQPTSIQWVMVTGRRGR